MKQLFLLICCCVFINCNLCSQTYGKRFGKLMDSTELYYSSLFGGITSINNSIFMSGQLLIDIGGLNNLPFIIKLDQNTNILGHKVLDWVVPTYPILYTNENLLGFNDRVLMFGTASGSYNTSIISLDTNLNLISSTRLNPFMYTLHVAQFNTNRFIVAVYQGTNGKIY